ncbi:tetratricopeptide repeat protein [Streptomyces sp. NPDC046909]|uniref:tetratricopeptide repeat protein n=1 Tax=Streptomyces sp. NPDC046909 TaxID=3155617 RepID=UPI00340D35F0
MAAVSIALRQAGRTDEAVVAHSRARDLYQELSNRDHEATVWNDLGIALQQAGRVDEARSAFVTVRDLREESGDWYQAGVALHNLALVHRSRAELGAARACWARAAEAFCQADAPAEAAEAAEARGWARGGE